MKLEQTARSSLEIILQDAAFDEEMTSNFMAMVEKEQYGAMIKALRAHRKTLVVNLHQAQRRVDTLDYLLYSLKSYMNQKEN